MTFEKAVQYIKEKQVADAPVGSFDNKPITKGKGRFGPYIKWDGMFINVPRRYNFDLLTQPEMNELIEAKVKKEENRFIHRWPDEKISVENARWGPIIKFGKKIIRLPKKEDDTKYTAEETQQFTLEQVKQFIEKEIPGAFAKKNKAGKKSASPKKTDAKKKAPKKKK
jgi:DNA topoisomerase-1